MKFRETKTRSTSKSVSWRVIAFLNSWFVLAVGLTEIPLWNALIMNLTGILFFYIHERVWNNIDYGRYSEKSK
jgi:adenylylsulfate kinase